MRPKTRSLNSLKAIAVLLTGAAGLFVATQRLDFVLLAGAISVMMVTVIITPIAAIVILLVLAPLRTLSSFSAPP
jgi:hypothetical protein